VLEEPWVGGAGQPATRAPAPPGLRRPRAHVEGPQGLEGPQGFGGTPSFGHNWHAFLGGRRGLETWGRGAVRDGAREKRARHGAGEARPLAVHVGGGIATCDAYHEQRAAHREALERGTAGAPERLALPVVYPSGHCASGEHRRGGRRAELPAGRQEQGEAGEAGAQEGDGDGNGGRTEVEPPLEGQPPVVGSESEDSDESASSDDERAARLGRKGRARPTLCLVLGQQAAVELQDTQSIINTSPVNYC